MLAYFARKNRANGPAAYSTLKPQTSSDSLFVRSNGAWLVSARIERNHIMVSGQDGKISHKYSWVVIIIERVNDPLINTTDDRMIASVTSHEIVCTVAHRVPITAHFEFEVQSDKRL